MSGIFISYRREDSADIAHRLHRALTARFGADSVFIDVENIGPGDNFAEVIDEKVGFCDALIAVIGKKWLNSRHADGQRRLDDPGDFVRLEIAAAVGRNIKVIPVLVDGASLPSQRELPASISALVEAQALELRSDRFDDSVDRLAAACEMVRKGSAAPSLWFALITRRHKALDPLDLHKPDVLWHALRFMACMVFIEALLHLPAAPIAPGAFAPKLWYLLDYTAAGCVQYLGAGFILHFSMKLFGGTAKLPRSIAAFCYLTAFAPLIAISQIPVWGINMSVLREAADAGWSPEQAIRKMQAFVSDLGTFGVLRVILAFFAATGLWLVYLSAVYQSFRTLHRLSTAPALLAFVLGLVGTLMFVTFVVTPQFGAIYKVLGS